ncbi:unnamed protein product [Rhizophagus irregularis]|nr:unnamed protein product [Rhizophagus irregularis]
MTSNFLVELSNDYKNIFESEIGYDVIIYAGVKPNIKEIHAHSYILCTRSRYFRSAFSNVWAEKKDGKFIFEKPNISPQLFDIILRFLYSGRATIWIAKLQDSTQLIGGYNPLDWNGYGRKNTRSSFLFNIPDGKNISTAKIRFNTAMCAIYCHAGHGPSMGDLYCPNSGIWFYDSKIGRNTIGIPSLIKIEEYEVFQVIKK